MPPSRPDPLIDTLFRGTVAPSAAPVRTAGTRSRAGNSMERTRAALLEGARRAVAAHGTKITMAQIAAAGGVAKATLYNHFRTRDDVLSTLAADEVQRIVAQVANRPLADAIESAAAQVAAHPLLKALARHDLGTLAALACVDPSADGWRAAREATVAALNAAGRRGTDTVLRLLASYITSPATRAAIAEDVAVLVAGLPGSGGRAEPEPPAKGHKQQPA
ncbi:MAG TPA: TetR/AcrR family transcriptional regulator [Jatrophihabitantaceae bacterium]|nr:TetR/AcrR family transcriptional regulator [Jatrophihabitantaceae bacterium]